MRRSTALAASREQMSLRAKIEGIGSPRKPAAHLTRHFGPQKELCNANAPPSGLNR
jgi:hypothetical protein